jgi:hypothetical protein
MNLVPKGLIALLLISAGMPARAGIAVSTPANPPVPVAGTALLTDFTVVYVMRKGDSVLARVEQRLQPQADGTYVYSSVSETAGLAKWIVKDVVTETSRFRAIGSKLQPLEYRFDRSGGLRDRRTHLKFDWTKGTVISEVDTNSWTLPIPTLAQDKLLYQLALPWGLENGDRDFDFNIPDGNRIKDYSFEIIGEETLSTALGDLHTVKLERLRKKRSTIVWCAPQWRHLPVQIQHREPDGQQLQMVIESVTGVSPTATQTPHGDKGAPVSRSGK